MEAVELVPAGRGREGVRAEVANDEPLTGGTRAARVNGVTAPLRLTRRGRGVLVVLAILTAVLLGFVGGRADAASESSRPETVSVVVRQGDSLWSLARQVAEPGEDLRDVVLEIQWLNGMQSAALAAGDVIQLPA